MSSDDQGNTDEQLKEIAERLGLFDSGYRRELKSTSHINDVHAGRVNPHVPTAEDLDVSWPSFKDSRFQ